MKLAKCVKMIPKHREISLHLKDRFQRRILWDMLLQFMDFNSIHSTYMIIIIISALGLRMS